MKKRTHDRARFYTPERLGEKRSVTPEGFLVCHDVPIARTGTQLYTPEEIPIDPGPDGLIRIERLPEEVFRDETIASFEGKAVTVNHPEDFVTPENWKQLAVGFQQNVRRGEGIEDDLLLADLVITDPAAIEYINKELPEVSAGYEAEYEQTGPGRGLQREIVGNHTALVACGRAGPRCSIQDKEPETMSKKTKDAPTLLARLLKAIKIGDSDEIEKVVKDAEEETPEQKAEREAAESKKAADEAAAGLEARLAKIESILAKLIPAEEEEHGGSFDADPDDEGGEKMTGDDILEAEAAGKIDQGQTYTGDSLKKIIARAEILAPGIAIPTGDALKSKDTGEKLMRKALLASAGTEEGKAAIEPFLMGGDVKKLTGDALLGVFSGAAELARHKNNTRGIRSGVSTKDFGRTLTVADINARNREFWANKAA